MSKVIFPKTAVVEYTEKKNIKYNFDNLLLIYGQYKFFNKQNRKVVKNNEAD
jgi:hypothetical protein